MIVKYGVTRVVFVFDKFVVKIPNFTAQHSHFLHGCYGNWQERVTTKQWRKMKYWDDCDFSKGINLSKMICPAVFCSWFGLFQIMLKCETLNRLPTKAEERRFKAAGFEDVKKDNMGMFEGRIVMLDYV